VGDALSNRKIAAEYIAALGRNDVAALMEMYTDDMCLRVPGSTCTSGVYSKAQVRELGARVPEFFPRGLAFVVHGMVAENDSVAVEAESTGTHVSGKLYNNRYHFLIRLREGRICEVREYLDTQMVHEVICGGQTADAPIGQEKTLR